MSSLSEDYYIDIYTGIDICIGTTLFLLHVSPQDLSGYTTVSTENATPQESTKSRKSDSLDKFEKQSSINKSRIWFELNIYRGIRVSRFGGFRGGRRQYLQRKLSLVSGAGQKHTRTRTHTHTHPRTHTHTHTEVQSTPAAVQRHLRCIRCLLITESPKTPSHYRYQI